MFKKALNIYRRAPLRLTTAFLLIVFYFLLPDRLFDVPYSTVVLDKNNRLMSAHIASDGQWRFPPGDSLPYQFEQCLLMFEDEYFNYHPGINPVSAVRALWQNFNAGKVVSGGSTLSMQTIRLAYNNRRTLGAKLWESLLAVRMEFRYSKGDILELYAAHAPFGGNVVGLQAASWRYFAVSPHQLSWAESATLAVLPNAPSLVHTGRNRELLKAKRDKLLKKLHKKGVIDEMELALSIDEPVVPHPEALPQIAPHLLGYFLSHNAGTIQQTTIDAALQTMVNQFVNRHIAILSNNEIHNAAVVVVDNNTGYILAYIGNSSPAKGNQQGHNVDVIRSPRSSGSILKPFLYAAALHDALITPQGLLPDVPTYYTDFSPQNYQRSYDGAVKANQALSRSLNIPAVRLLDDYGTDRFLQFLRKAGITTMNKAASHYGLSLILGGAETTLFDLAGVYASMARTLNNYEVNNFGYSTSDIHSISFKKAPSAQNLSKSSVNPHLFSAASVWFTFEALTQVQRPPEEFGWEEFAGSRRIAWKTGTSFGFRDAWAIGVTPQYTVGVWVGNASGEGRPGIVGGTAAAPILFDVFRLLPATTWFTMPFEDLIQEKICTQSGYLASIYCTDVDTAFLPRIELPFPMCSYHKPVHLTKDGTYRVTEACCPVSQMSHQNRFVLPPLMEYYYRNKNPLYQPLPPMLPGCTSGDEQPMEFVYPRPNVALFIPKNLEGKSERVVLRVAHRQTSARLFWHLNDLFIGETQRQHHLEVDLLPGWHTLTVVDEEGNKLTRRIQCVNQ